MWALLLVMSAIAVDEQRLSGVELDALEQEMLSKLTPDERARHDAFLKDFEDRASSTWYAKLLDRKAAKPMAPLVAVAAATCKHALLGRKQEVTNLATSDTHPCPHGALDSRRAQPVSPSIPAQGRAKPSHSRARSTLPSSTGTPRRHAHPSTPGLVASRRPLARVGAPPHCDHDAAVPPHVPLRSHPHAAPRQRRRGGTDVVVRDGLQVAHGRAR